MLATALLLPTAGGWPLLTLAALLWPSPSAAAAVSLGTLMHVCWQRVVREEGAVAEEEYHTFSNFPVSGVNFPHFSKCVKCELLHKEVWEMWLRL